MSEHHWLVKAADRYAELHKKTCCATMHSYVFAMRKAPRFAEKNKCPVCQRVKDADVCNLRIGGCGYTWPALLGAQEGGKNGT